MDFKKQKLQELKSIQQELSNQLELIKQDIQRLEKEVDERNCPIMSRINEHVQNNSLELNKPDLKRVKRY
jgi:prefoldin subunit 5